ncbi:MAG TPA: InlB B-repeat-containing protein [Bacilli bacterium]|nr:InlB B-repeat-containing protein [Bacilli bacterium]
MKKIIATLLIVVFGVILAGCEDRKINDDTLSVVFYTGLDNAYVKTIYNLQKGSKIPKPEDPVVTDENGNSILAFEGWFKDRALDTPWDFDVDTIEKSTTLYAKWSPVVFTITYELRGGYFPEGVEARYPKTYTYLSPDIIFPTDRASWPVHDDKSKGLFIGWYTQLDLTPAQLKDKSNYPKFDRIKSKSSGNIVLYAYYLGDTI